MCAYTSVPDAQRLARKMVKRGVAEAEMLSAQPVFDSVSDDEAERVWQAIVATARGSQS